MIELLIAVVIVSILAAIAVPSYQNYIRRGERQKGAACMMDISKRMQTYQQRKNVYPTALDQIGYPTGTTAAPCPESRYTVAITSTTEGAACSGSGIDRFQLQAVPITGSSQVADGYLRLTQCFDGTTTRFREKGDNQW